MTPEEIKAADDRFFQEQKLRQAILAAKADVRDREAVRLAFQKDWYKNEKMFGALTAQERTAIFDELWKDGEVLTRSPRQAEDSDFTAVKAMLTPGEKNLELLQAAFRKGQSGNEDTIINPMDNLTFYDEEIHGYDDTSNALRLVRQYGDRFKIVYPTIGEIVWNGQRWLTEQGLMIRNYVIEMFKTEEEIVKTAYGDPKLLSDDEKKERSKILGSIRSCRQVGKVKACVEMASSFPTVRCHDDELDCQPYLFNVLGKTLNLREGKAHNPKSEDLLTVTSTVRYDPTAQCPEWIQFVQTLMEGDAQMVAFLQRVVGYSLTGNTTEKSFFVLLGEANTGKTTFMNTLLTLMGEYGATSSTATFMVKNFESISNDVARLAKARLVSTSEAKDRQMLSEEFVKIITGGGKLVARFMRKEFFEFTPQFKLFLDTNQLPKIDSEDQALWNRMKVITFSHVFHPEERRADIANVLRSELPGILNWALIGCKEWWVQGLNTPEIVERRTRQQQEEADKYHGFLSQWCFQGGKIKTADLYKAYLLYCKQEDQLADRYIPSQRLFTQAIKKRGYEKKTDGSFQCFYGIQLTPATKARLGLPMNATEMLNTIDYSKFPYPESDFTDN